MSSRGQFQLYLVEAFLLAPGEKHVVLIQNGNAPVIGVDVMNYTFDAHKDFLPLRQNSDPISDSELRCGCNPFLKRWHDTSPHL